MSQQLEILVNESSGLYLFIIITLVVWSLVWKGMALWKSARLSNKRWFVILLIINTLGILEILYLFVFSKKKDGVGNEGEEV